MASGRALSTFQMEDFMTEEGSRTLNLVPILASTGVISLGPREPGREVGLLDG